MLCSWIALAAVLAAHGAHARPSDCDFDETGKKLRCGVHEPIDLNAETASSSAALPRWLLGTWTGQRGDGTPVSLTWVDRGGALDGVLEETTRGVHQELRRFTVGSRIPVQPQFRPYSLSLWVRAGREQYLFAGYAGVSEVPHLRFDRRLKWRGVTASSFVAATEFSLLDGELILVDMIGPQHGAMPERRLVFRRAAPGAAKAGTDGTSR